MQSLGLNDFLLEIFLISEKSIESHRNPTVAQCLGLTVAIHIVHRNLDAGMPRAELLNDSRNGVEHGGPEHADIDTPYLSLPRQVCSFSGLLVERQNILCLVVINGASIGECHAADITDE